jgi:hypothetical protein
MTKQENKSKLNGHGIIFFFMHKVGTHKISVWYWLTTMKNLNLKSKPWLWTLLA